MTRKWLVMAIAGTALVLTALAYLRDPPWLRTLTSGLGEWQVDGGVRYRWMGGHASFFVRADGQVVQIPLRATFENQADWPIIATITIDDRPADRLVLSDPAWRRSVLRLPPVDGRRSRRIDIRVNRLRGEFRGVHVGEIEIE